MSDCKNFRVILDLSRFFHDHRRTARVFIKHCKTIKDLQNRVSEIFGIDGFYVSTAGQFLPASEDIRVLHDDEVVCVTPDTSTTNSKDSNHKVSSSMQHHSIDNKQQKRLFECISQSDVGSLEDQSPQKKKKVKQGHIANKNATPKKEKKSKDNKSCNSESQASCSKSESNTQASQQSIVEKEICNMEVAHKISEIKKKLKQKNDEFLHRHSNISSVKLAEEPSGSSKTVLTKLKSYIKNCSSIPSTPTLPDTVRLSRHVDTPIKTFTKYIPPQRNTDQYLAKNKINIVKIDVIKENAMESNSRMSNIENIEETETSTGNIKDPESPPQNYVKAVVSSLEKNISPNAQTESNNIVEMNQNEASNYTKIFLDQKDANAPTILKSKILGKISTDSPNTSIESDNNAELKRKISNVESVVNYLKESDSVLSQESDAYILESKIHSEKTSTDSPSISIRSNNHAALHRKISGVGSLVNALKESDSVLSQESANTLESKIQSEKTILDTPNTSVEFINNAALKQQISSVGSLASYLKESDSVLSQESDSYTLESKIQLEKTITDTPNTSIELISNAALKKKISSVGSLVNYLKESDSVFSQESDTSSQYVTKRKRVRRKRKSKNKDKNQGSEPTFINPIPKPMISESCPKIHIRFEDKKEDETEEKMDVIEDILEDKLNTEKEGDKDKLNPEKEEGCQNNPIKTENAAELLPAPEIAFLSDENEDSPVMENKSIFGREYILNAPLMENRLQPKVGDIIAFKVLKLAENYSPLISDYIVGKVEIYLLENKTVYFKILSGEQELLPPTGKLSFDLTDKENIQNSKYKEIKWSEILEPKLLYP